MRFFCSRQWSCRYTLTSLVIFQKLKDMKKRQETSDGLRKLSPEEYHDTFMYPYKIEDRKLVFISRKLRDTPDHFACDRWESHGPFRLIGEYRPASHRVLYWGFRVLEEAVSPYFHSIKKHFGGISFSGALKMETFIFGGSEVIFRASRKPRSTPEIAEAIRSQRSRIVRYIITVKRLITINWVI